MAENKVQSKIRLNCSKLDTRIFRNQVGTGYSPTIVKAALGLIFDPFMKSKIAKLLTKGFMKFGFGEGSSDLIGIKTVEITSDMVGKKIGVFFAVECKDVDSKTNPIRLEKQTKFINMIKSLGGRAGFATSTQEADKIING